MKCSKCNQEMRKAYESLDDPRHETGAIKKLMWVCDNCKMIKESIELADERRWKGWQATCNVYAGSPHSNLVLYKRNDKKWEEGVFIELMGEDGTQRYGTFKYGGHIESALWNVMMTRQMPSYAEGFNDLIKYTRGEARELLISIQRKQEMAERWSGPQLRSISGEEFFSRIG